MIMSGATRPASETSKDSEILYMAGGTTLQRRDLVEDIAPMPVTKGESALCTLTLRGALSFRSRRGKR